MMKNKICVLAVLSFMSGHVMADVASVKFSNISDGQKVKSPVEVCMQAQGVMIEPVKNGVREGSGHLHILVDVDVPANLTVPLPTDKPTQFIHLGDGSNCRTLELAPGKHVLHALLANAAHVPGNPAVSQTIKIIVE